MKQHHLRLQKEVEWYQNKFDGHHFLNQWPFYSAKRNMTAYDVAKKSLMRSVAEHIPCAENVLVAPCGLWHDLPYLKSVWPAAKYVGIDISPTPRPPEETHVGDIRAMPFGDKTFDVAVATLFFHHVVDEGFSEYLKEYKRVLKANAFLIAMEQSMFHPLFAITRPLRALVGNITGQVEHEHPISIRRLAEDCRAAGFSKVETFSCSFGHNRMPIPLRAIINTALYPFRSMPVAKHCGWQVGLIATASG